MHQCKLDWVQKKFLYIVFGDRLLSPGQYKGFFMEKYILRLVVEEKKFEDFFFLHSKK